MSHAFAARQWATMKLFEGVSRHKGKVLISLVITTLAMSLLLVAFTLSLTAYNSVKGVSVAQEMTIFTNQGVSSERAANLKETIEKQPGITRVRLVSPDEALGLIGDTDNTDLSFSTNPLPNILLATVSTDIPEKQVDETAKFIEKQPGVDSVAYDSTWNSNIQALKNAFTKFGLLTGGLLCGLILMVLLGSASLAATTPLKEALRLNSMGAPTSFIVRPDAWRAGFVFLLASLASIVIADLAISSIAPALSTALGLYHLPVTFQPLPLSWQVAFIVVSFLLGNILGGLTSYLGYRGKI